jgi:hypothetical protein
MRLFYGRSASTTEATLEEIRPNRFAFQYRSNLCLRPI